MQFAPSVHVHSMFREEYTTLFWYSCDGNFGDYVDNSDNEVDRTEQIFNFADVPSFVSLFSGSPNEPLYFVKVTVKGTASENHSDLYSHFISTGGNFLKGFYLKLVRLRNASKKKYQLLPNEVVFSPDEVFICWIFRWFTYW